MQQHQLQLKQGKLEQEHRQQKQQQKQVLEQQQQLTNSGKSALQHCDKYTRKRIGHAA